MPTDEGRSTFRPLLPFPPKTPKTQVYAHFFRLMLRSHFNVIRTVFINTSGFFIGGHSTPHPSYAPLFPLPASFPTLHVIGKNDTIVPHVETEFMTKMCLNKRVEWHMGGELQNAQDLRGCTLIGGPCRPFCAHESLLERFLQVGSR